MTIYRTLIILTRDTRYYHPWQLTNILKYYIQ